MRILLSNDDGYFAPGLERLAAELAPHADITVVAPERDRSGASNSLTLDRPLTVRRAPNGFLFVNGTDRKSTRLNSSHITISYAVFCLKKKNPAVLADLLQRIDDQRILADTL